MPRYVPCPDPIDPSDVADDTVELISTEASIARGERRLELLARLADIGVVLAEALVDQVKETPAADLAVAYAKIAQTVRRTIALEAHLSAGLPVRGPGPGLAAKPREREDTVKVKARQEEAWRGAILEGIGGAISERFPDENSDAHWSRMDDVECLLFESDEFAGYLDRPVGEAIAKLCQALGLDPEWAVEQEGAWMIKRRNAIPELECDWPGALLHYAKLPAPEEIDPAPD